MLGANSDSYPVTRSAKLQSFGRARRGDANARPQAPDRLPHAFDPFELARECRQNLARKIVGKLLRQRRAEFGLDSANDRIEPQPQETLARLLVAQMKASLAEPATGHGERDHLAVDEHAVAIENDDLGPAGLQVRMANLPLGLAQDLVRATLSAWNAANAPPAGAARTAIADIDSIAETSVCVPAATAPIIAEPSSTGSGVSGASTVLPHTSAMIWRTSGLRAAPPLTTIASNS